jgi:hypothetical protein
VSTAVQTQQISTADTSGSPIQLAYGYVWATGKRLAYYMRENTSNNNLDYTRVGAWALGLGEWDGCNELWINDLLTWTSEFDDSTEFHFHRGADSVIGSGLTPVSIGTDQGCDAFWAYYPDAVGYLDYNRIAYYMITASSRSSTPRWCRMTLRSGLTSRPSACGVPVAAGCSMTMEIRPATPSPRILDGRLWMRS